MNDLVLMCWGHTLSLRTLLIVISTIFVVNISLDFFFWLFLSFSLSLSPPCFSFCFVCFAFPVIRSQISCFATFFFFFAFFFSFFFVCSLSQFIYIIFTPGLFTVGYTLVISLRVQKLSSKFFLLSNTHTHTLRLVRSCRCACGLIWFKLVMYVKIGVSLYVFVHENVLL